MDCPGAVSLSASKAVLGFSKSIVVDLSETAALPEKVKTAYRTGGASIPIVIFTDPGVTQTFGRFDHPAMKKQNYREIFQPARAGILAARKKGTFLKGGQAPVIVKVENAKIEAWKSAAGTEIKAKLTGVQDDSIYLFETEDGQAIQATARQLDPKSVARARELAKLED